MRNPNSDWIDSPGTWTAHLLLVIFVKLCVTIVPGVTREASWTITHLIYNFVFVPDCTPFDTAQGEFSQLTFWEQMDNGKQFTKNKKMLTIFPIGLFLAVIHFTDYDRTTLLINCVSLLIVLIGKLPVMHKVRLFGINKSVYHFETFISSQVFHQTLETAWSMNILILLSVFLSINGSIEDRFNYASSDCAATVLSTSKAIKNSMNVLRDHKDAYMITKCSELPQNIVIELCEEIKIDLIAVANYEFFSSMISKFHIYYSTEWPTKDWIFASTIDAKNTRDLQIFRMEIPFTKYLKFEFSSFIGTKTICPLSQIKVFGNTMIQDFKQSTAIAVVDKPLDGVCPIENTNHFENTNNLICSVDGLSTLQERDDNVFKDIFNRLAFSESNQRKLLDAINMIAGSEREVQIRHTQVSKRFEELEKEIEYFKHTLLVLGVLSFLLLFSLFILVFIMWTKKDKPQTKTTSLTDNTSDNISTHSSQSSILSSLPNGNLFTSDSE